MHKKGVKESGLIGGGTAGVDGEETIISGHRDIFGDTLLKVSKVIKKDIKNI